MDSVASTLISNAGAVGAALVVLGWAYWQKEKSEKAAQIALVKQAEKHAETIAKQQAEFTEQLQAIAAKRTEDAQKVTDLLLGLVRECTNALQSVAVTSSDLKTVLEELRRDVRDRNRRGSVQGIRPPVDPQGE